MVSSIDVAKLAGVSQATVSRVLNNPEKVNKPTLDKVNAAIRQLNYRPNAAARSLISRKSGVIAVVSGPLDNPDNADFSNYIIKHIQQIGLIVEIHIQDPANPKTVFPAIQNTQAEGIIFGPVTIDEIEIAKLKRTEIPLVFCGTDPLVKEDSLSMDNRAAGRIAADYIHSISPVTVGWLGGDPSNTVLKERYQGFLEVAKQKNIEVLKAMAVGDEMDAALSAMFARKKRPTALVGATDVIAAYAMDFLIDYGYSIPEDVSVLGIGNSSFSSMNYVNLSSIGLPANGDIYKQAVNRMAVLLENDVAEDLTLKKIKPLLFERKTTGFLK